MFGLVMKQTQTTNNHISIFDWYQHYDELFNIYTSITDKLIKL